MFPDVELVRDMQKELDQVIQLGVANITRLVRAAEVRSPGALIIDSEDDFEVKHLQVKNSSWPSQAFDDDEGGVPLQKTADGKKRGGGGAGDDNIAVSANAKDILLASAFLQAKTSGKKSLNQQRGGVSVGQGRLATKLIKDGLITPEMLAKLQEEWKLNTEQHGGSSGGRRDSGADSDSNGGSTFRPNNHRRGRRR
jgi:hypothetical protein